MVCERCGKKLDRFEEEELFKENYPHLELSDFKGTLCAECASDALENEEDGIFLLTCGQCGRTFDYVEEKIVFDRSVPEYDGMEYWDEWGIDPLCATCVLQNRESDDE